MLDLGIDVPGPYCAKLLADFGADVIKVESPAGDPARRAGPFPDDLPHAEKSGLFLYLNANKRGITLDRRTRSGRDLFLRLAAWADVVIENDLPGTLEAQELGWQRLAEVNPGLVLTSITPFGQTGPYRDHAADEITLFAMSGRMWSHGQAEREPLRYAPDMAWFQAGQTAAVATLAAVLASRRFGIGQHVDVSALEALAGNVDTRSIFVAMTGQAPQRPPRAGVTASSGVVPCKDGFVLMIAAGERFFRRLLRAMGRPDLVEDARFATAAARLEHRDELDAMLLPWMAERTRHEVFQQLQAFSVMCAPIQQPHEVFGDPQLRERDFFVQAEHSQGGRALFPGAPFIMSETPWAFRRPAPRLGEHNAEVFDEVCGLSPSDLAVLAATGAV